MKFYHKSRKKRRQEVNGYLYYAYLLFPVSVPHSLLVLLWLSAKKQQVLELLFLRQSPTKDKDKQKTFLGVSFLVAMTYDPFTYMVESPLDWLLSVSPHSWCSYMQNVSGKGLVKGRKKKDRKLYGNIRKFPWMNIINNKNKIHAWKYLRCFRSFSISIFCSVTVFRKCWFVCHKNKSETFSIRTFRNCIFKDNIKHISKKQNKTKR